MPTLNGERVRREIFIRGLNHKEFAKRAGIHYVTLSWALNGRGVSLDTLWAIHRALEEIKPTAAAELVAGDG